MKPQSYPRQFSRTAAGSAEARANPLLLLLIAGGIAVGGYWVGKGRPTPPPPTTAIYSSAPVLSVQTRQALAGLTADVELRLYAPTDAEALAETTREYLYQVQQWLAEYARGGAGRVRFSQHDPQTDPAAKSAATAAGMVPFVSETGAIVYLGLTVSSGGQVELLPALTPEWAGAFEADLTRAIQRVTARRSDGGRREIRPGHLAADPLVTPVDPELSEALLKRFPDLAQRPRAELAQILRGEAFAEYKTVAEELQQKISAAEQELAAAQAKKSEAASQAALRQLQSLQHEQADKLKAITARLQEQLTTLEQLTTAPALPPSARQ